MQVATGKVIAGKVVVEGLTLAEGELVTIVTRQDEAAVTLSPDEEAELLDAIAEADAGDTLPADTFLAGLRRAS